MTKILSAFKSYNHPSNVISERGGFLDPLLEPILDLAKNEATKELGLLIEKGKREAHEFTLTANVVISIASLQSFRRERS